MSESKFKHIFTEEFLKENSSQHTETINVETLKVGDYVFRFVEQYYPESLDGESNSGVESFMLFDAKTGQRLKQTTANGHNLDSYGLLNYIPKWCGDVWPLVDQNPTVASYFEEYLASRDVIPLTLDENGKMFYKGELVETFVSDGSVKWRAPNSWRWHQLNQSFDSIQEVFDAIDKSWPTEDESEQMRSK